MYLLPMAAQINESTDLWSMFKLMGYYCIRKINLCMSSKKTENKNCLNSKTCNAAVRENKVQIQTYRIVFTRFNYTSQIDTYDNVLVKVPWMTLIQKHHWHFLCLRKTQTLYDFEWEKSLTLTSSGWGRLNPWYLITRYTNVKEKKSSIL